MHTNTTTNYSLPQFVGTDKPSWLGDFNGAMSAIDTAIHAREVEAGTAQSSADTANAKADTLDTRMGTAETNITALQNASTTDHAQIATNTSNIAQNAQDIVQLDAKIGHTQITIGDNTVTGAIATLAEGGGVTIDSAESTTSENPLQNKVITLAMNAIRSLITAIQTLLGSETLTTTAQTVTGAINELAQGGGTVRYDATTDRFEVLYNNTWVQSIKAWVQSIAFFVAGVFGIEVNNGQYTSTDEYSPIPYTVNGNELNATISTAYTEASVISDELIDFTKYSSVKATINGTEYTLDVSGYNGSAYLIVYSQVATLHGTLITHFALAMTKEDFSHHFVSGTLVTASPNLSIGATVRISNIVIE